MSDSDGPKSKGIPSWQRQDPSSASYNPDNTLSQKLSEQKSSASRASLIEQASKFLEDDSIHDAPTERKKEFLVSKGLTEAEIHNLLSTLPKPEAAAVMDDDDDYNTEQQGSSRPTTLSTPRDQPTSSSTQERQQQQQQQPPRSTAPPPKNEQPPIITYPEFLLHAQKPAPLITADRLLTSLSIASGFAAAIYGTSQYVIGPMLTNLTSARHSLLQTAGANLDTLNGKLEGVVSRVPERRPPPPHSEEQEEGKKEDGDGATDTDSDSVTSADGSRFFNRSAGTQTSPHLSRSPSSSSSSSSRFPPPSPSTTIPPNQKHTTALSDIHRKLIALLPTTKDEDREAIDPLGHAVAELRTYLEELPSATSLYPGGGGGTMSGGKKKKGGDGRGEGIDAMANVKADIRAVKGVLLSARNFPGGATVRR